MTALLNLLLSALSTMACTVSPAYAGAVFDDADSAGA
jgi:hypothetical protein